jgi:hypothetical protein
MGKLDKILLVVLVAVAAFGNLCVLSILADVVVTGIKALVDL